MEVLIRRIHISSHDLSKGVNPIQLRGAGVRSSLLAGDRSGVGLGWRLPFGL
jgi:hypothetical protein